MEEIKKLDDENIEVTNISKVIYNKSQLKDMLHKLLGERQKIVFNVTEQIQEAIDNIENKLKGFEEKEVKNG